MNRAGKLTRSQITFLTTPLTLKGVILCIYMPMCLHLLSQYSVVLYARDCLCNSHLQITLCKP